ncbi:MAG TPA: hypothetical protein V6D03_12125, partial [Candidatus Caenarcaniphilales bacterium]
MTQYDKTKQFTTTIDIYYPVTDSTANPVKLPLVLLLQGALVDKAKYANFAARVPSYGFVVVVPNHHRLGTLPNVETVTGLLPEQQQVNDVLGHTSIENENSASPIAGLLNTDNLGLLGHSFG